MVGFCHGGKMQCIDDHPDPHGNHDHHRVDCQRQLWGRLWGHPGQQVVKDLPTSFSSNSASQSKTYIHSHYLHHLHHHVQTTAIIIIWQIGDGSTTVANLATISWSAWAMHAAVQQMMNMAAIAIIIIMWSRRWQWRYLGSLASIWVAGAEVGQQVVAHPAHRDQTILYNQQPPMMINKLREVFKDLKRQKVEFSKSCTFCLYETLNTSLIKKKPPTSPMIVDEPLPSNRLCNQHARNRNYIMLKTGCHHDQCYHHQSETNTLSLSSSEVFHNTTST